MRIRRFRRQVFSVTVFLTGAVISLSTLGKSDASGAGLVPDKDYEIHPYLEGRVTYDENARLQNEDADEESDVFGEAEFGVDFTKRLRGGTLSGSGYLFTRRYEDFDALDHQGGGERLRFNSGGEGKVDISLYQSFQRIEDYARYSVRPDVVDAYDNLTLLSEDRASRSERDEWDAGVQLGVDLTDKMIGTVGYTYDTVIYEEESLLDSEQHKANVELGWKVTAKSAAFLQGQAGQQVSDGLQDDPRFYRARAGWQTHITGKTAFKGSAGAEFYDADADADGEDHDREIFSYDIAGVWTPRPALSFQVMAGNTIQPSTYDEGTTREIARASVSAAIRLNNAVSLSAAGTYRNEDYEEVRSAEETTESRELDSYGARLGVAFSPPEKWYTLFANATYETTESNLPDEDFNQTRISAGGRISY